MKKIFISLLLVVPVLLYLKLRKGSSEENTKILKKNHGKSQSKSKPGNSRIPEDDETINKTTRCKAITSNGKRCLRTSLSDSEFCWQHS